MVAGVEQAARVLLDLDGLCKYHHRSGCGLVEHIATDWITHACVGTACGLLACSATDCELSMPALAQLVACLQRDRLNSLWAAFGGWSRDVDYAEAGNTGLNRQRVMPSVSPRGRECFGGLSCYLRLDRKVGLTGPRHARGKTRVGRSWRRCGAGVIDTLMTSLGRGSLNRAGYL